jgi:hypothetical protein
MENPPKVEGGHRRAMSDDCDVVIRDVEDGVVLVIDNRDKIMYTMRFDFGASENLKLVPGTDVESAGPMKCNIEAKPGTVRNLCHLQIADRETLDHFEMKYRVQCLVRNAKGELEQVRPPAPKAEKEERKKLTDTLDIIFLEQGGGYVVFFESSDADQYRCVLDISGSQNLELLTGPGTTTVDATKCSFAVDPRSRVAVAKLDLVDPSKPITLSYRVKHEKDSSRTVAADKAKADDAAAAKKKADDAAAKKKADDDAAAAKKKADDDAAAAKKKADDDAAAKKKADDDAAAKKKADDDAAAKKKADDDAAAAKKKADDDAAAKKKADDDAAAADDDAAAKKAESRAKMMPQQRRKRPTMRPQQRRRPTMMPPQQRRRPRTMNGSASPPRKRRGSGRRSGA